MKEINNHIMKFNIFLKIYIKILKTETKKETLLYENDFA